MKLEINKEKIIDVKDVRLVGYNVTRFEQDKIIIFTKEPKRVIKADLEFEDCP